MRIIFKVYYDIMDYGGVYKTEFDAPEEMNLLGCQGLTITRKRSDRAADSTTSCRWQLNLVARELHKFRHLRA